MYRSSYLKLCQCTDPSRKLFSTLVAYGKPNCCRSVLLLSCNNYCDNKKDAFLNAGDKNVQHKVLQNVIRRNKDLLRETEQRLRFKSNVILRDIKSTKDKVKERMEEVIEVLRKL